MEIQCRTQVALLRNENPRRYYPVTIVEPPPQDSRFPNPYTAGEERRAEEKRAAAEEETRLTESMRKGFFGYLHGYDDDDDGDGTIALLPPQGRALERRRTRGVRNASILVRRHSNISSEEVGEVESGQKVSLIDIDAQVALILRHRARIISPLEGWVSLYSTSGEKMLELLSIATPFRATRSWKDWGEIAQCLQNTQINIALGSPRNDGAETPSHSASPRKLKPPANAKEAAKAIQALAIDAWEKIGAPELADLLPKNDDYTFKVPRGIQQLCAHLSFLSG
eukprot:jgi/Bigna1/84186/fgenesh1_pg.125_\